MSETHPSFCRRVACSSSGESRHVSAPVSFGLEFEAPARVSLSAERQDFEDGPSEVGVMVSLRDLGTYFEDGRAEFLLSVGNTEQLIAALSFQLATLRAAAS